MKVMAMMVFLLVMVNGCATVLSQTQRDNLVLAQALANKAVDTYHARPVTITPAVWLPPRVAARYAYDRIELAPHLLDTPTWFVVLAHELAHHVLGHRQEVTAHSRIELELVMRAMESAANVKAIELMTRAWRVPEEKAFKGVFLWMYGTTFNPQDDVLPVYGHQDTCAELSALVHAFPNGRQWAVEARNEIRLERKSPCEITPPEPRPPAPKASLRIVDPPTWQIGDEWRYRWQSPIGAGTFVWTVKGEEVIDGVSYWVVASGSRTLYYTKPTLGWAMDKVQGAVVARATPPLAVAWPLQVGKQWDVRYTSENITEKQTEQVSLTCRVEEETEVTVRAGNFLTLYVACKNQVGRAVYELWYAPQVKLWVKERRLFGYGERLRELVSYTTR